MSQHEKLGDRLEVAQPKFQLSELSEGLCKFLDSLIEEMVEEDLSRLSEQGNGWTEQKKA